MFGMDTACDISKLPQIMWDNFEITLVVFMPGITTNHAITYTNCTPHGPITITNICNKITNTEQVPVRKWRTLIHATKTKDDLAASYQTLNLKRENSVRIPLVNCTELTLYCIVLSAVKIHRRAFVSCSRVKACNFSGFVNIGSETFPFERATQLWRSMRKTTSCDKTSVTRLLLFAD